MKSAIKLVSLYVIFIAVLIGCQKKTECCECPPDHIFVPPDFEMCEDTPIQGVNSNPNGYTYAWEVLGPIFGSSWIEVKEGLSQTGCDCDN